MTEFVHLHLHTEYSLLDGACRIGELMAHAEKTEAPALAVTEHGNLFSSVTFHDEARKRGIKPILGCEVYVAPGDRKDRTAPRGDTNNHLVLLAENLIGYHNLIKLVSKGYTEGFYYKPRIDKALLSEHAEGLIGLSACLKGEVATHLTGGRPTAATAAAAQYQDILGQDSFFLEMQFQGIDAQRVVNTGLIPISRDLGLPLVCTNDVHYLRREDQKPHDVLLCIGMSKNVNDANRLRYHGDQFYLKTPDEMAAVFGDYPEALSNTVAVAERCDVELAKGESHLPDFEVPDGFTVDTYFERVAREGFKDRLPSLRAQADAGTLKHAITEYEQRLAYEIDIIRKMRYPGYFLIVWDFIRHAREKGIPVGPGRGSAAGSLVAWCLRITDVDPLRFDLIFERFLNPERVSLPDIDIDFCERRRGEVIDYVTRKYGRDNVAQIITFGTMKARAVIRDVGRTMGLSYSEVDRVAKQVPGSLGMTLDRALAENPRLKTAAREDPRIGELVSVARRLEGVTRHASVHAAGVVITPRPITDLAPVYKSQKDEITTQWAMNQVERMGLLKMDFLGLSTLTLAHDALAHIRETTGKKIELETLPDGDPKTYDLFCEGQTLGVFQFESDGMREILRRSKPRSLEDLIALNALYRPGPLQGGVVDKYIARKAGREPVVYDWPALEPILKNTYGVIAYQEQVMRIASDLAGFTMGDADLLRKAMGKKDPKVMEAQHRKFIEGAICNGMRERYAETIFNFMRLFAGYGFNKSHSTAYALLAYQTAWLKANHPQPFMAALLTIEAQNTSKLAAYLNECRDMAIPVLPPDLNTSRMGFRVTPDGIQFGLAAVKNVGEGSMGSLLSCREKSGRVGSIFELCETIDLRAVNKRILENLIKAGALDSTLDPDAGPAQGRPRLLAALDSAVEYGQRLQRDKEQGQAQLFGPVASGGSSDDAPRLPGAEAWTPAQQLSYEKEALGLYLSGHPVDRYQTLLNVVGARPVATGGENTEQVRIGGIVTALRVRKTKTGQDMATFTLEDRTGGIETVVFPKTYARSTDTVVADQLVVVSGRIEREEDAVKILAEDVGPIETLADPAGRSLLVQLSSDRHDRRDMAALAELFKSHKGPTPVEIEMALPDRTPPLRVRAKTKNVRVKTSAELFEAAERISGRGTISWRARSFRRGGRP